MGVRKLLWKFSNHQDHHQDHHRRSPFPASPASTAAVAEMPLEFLCPISRSLMADPVIVPPSGRTFERSCIQACADLAFVPPGLDLDASTPLVLVPNIALKTTILRWCDRVDVPLPLPFPETAARALVSQLMPPSSDLPPVLPPPAATGDRGTDQRGQVLSRFEALSLDEEDQVGNDDNLGVSWSISEEKDGKFRSKSSSQQEHSSREATNPKTPHPFSVRTKKQTSYASLASTSSGSSYCSSSSNSSVNDMYAEQFRTCTDLDLPLPPTAEMDLSEEEIIMIKLMGMEESEQESAVASLRLATRGSRERRIELCTPRLLAALRPMLLSHNDTVQIGATAAVVNLSLESENRARISKSGVVLPLVQVLNGGHPEARGHAAAVIFSLALEDENRATIGVLGAIPPLINLFTLPTADGASCRRDAGMALYHLSLNNANRSKIARAPGSVRALFSVASEREEAPPPRGPSLRRLALMVVCNLAGSNEGRAALMDGGAVASVVSLMRSPTGAKEEEYCVAMLYGMSRGSLRFRGLARSAGAEQELMRVAEGCGEGGHMRQKMAKKTLRAMRGEDDEDAAPLPSMAILVDDGGSVVSEGMLSFRRRPNHQASSRLNTTEF